MRSYKEMVESGDWPPKNRETILFIIGGIIGAIVGFAGGFVYYVEIMKCQ